MKWYSHNEHGGMGLNIALGVNLLKAEIKSYYYWKNIYVFIHFLKSLINDHNVKKSTPQKTKTKLDTRRHSQMFEIIYVF